MTQIFKKKPAQWGLRGDPFLWDDMTLYFSKLPPIKTTEEFEQFLNTAFYELTGEKIKRGKHIHLKKYEKGGISSGEISSGFWLDKAFPMLIERFKELKK